MILSALNDYYQRLAEEDKVPVPGFSTEQIDYEILIDKSGNPLQVNFIGRVEGKRRFGVPLRVPQSFKRPGTTPRSFFLWDKTAFVLGVKRNPSASENESQYVSSPREHQAFRELHERLLKKSEDRRLKALLAFIDQWEASMFSEPLFSSEVLDKNIVFRMEGDLCFIHEIESAKEIQEKVVFEGDAKSGRCLVTGEVGRIARLHPSIKGVKGAQPTGGSIVSFDKDAFRSYGNSQGDNSPVSEVAAFGYTTALNYLLRGDIDNRQRLQIGDATVVFWAKAKDTAHAEAAEGFFALLNEPPSDEQEAAKLATLLTQVAQGRPLEELDPMLESGTRFFVLGLAPNAARLSVRFWYEDSLERLAQNYAWHHQDLQLEPTPWRGVAPSSQWLAKQVAPIRKKDGNPSDDDVPPRLAGELMRSILTGYRYPQALLSNLVMRFRSDGHITGERVALCKAILARDARISTNAQSINQEVPVSLEPHSTHLGYLLGRLFAELENAQREALGKEINATIRDRYYGAASATPANVFPMLTRNVVHHFSRIRKDNRENVAYSIEKKIGEIMKKLPSDFPKHLNIRDQGRFSIGYYQQKWTRQDKDKPTQGDSV